MPFHPLRRAYEKHFKEWRHQNGMRALGIPNTKSMFEVTMIDEALALWQSMQVREEHIRLHSFILSFLTSLSKATWPNL